MDETALNVFVDGAARAHRKGGIGIHFVFVDEAGNEHTEDLAPPGYKRATIGEMELEACIVALEEAYRFESKVHFTKIVVHSDSIYVVNGYNRDKFNWQRRGWKKASGAPVLNHQRWKKLLKVAKLTGKIVRFEKAVGHSSDLHNHAAHRLATQSAKNPLRDPLSVSIPRRKLSKEMTRTGSVGMKGQRLKIRIDEGKYLEKNLYRYRFEVISKSSPYYRKVDFLCSDIPLREARIYSVRLNSDQANPRIAKLFKEILPKPKAGLNDPGLSDSGAKSGGPEAGTLLGGVVDGNAGQDFSST